MMDFRTILIVEDDAELQAALRQLLERAGYEAVCAANGREALEYLETRTPPPSLILLDVRMPLMSGEDFRAAQLKDRALCAVPVVLMSADVELEAKAARLHLPHLVKPIDRRSLLEVVRKYASHP
jgi:CheY-like chemotaxis protein